jgi:renalase
MRDVLVVGAGIAGVQCARRLRGAGADVLLVDRADKVGGRCATRSFDGQAADYGSLFIHGQDAGFLAAVGETAGAHRLEGWPQRIVGSGTPCQPQAFAPREKRLAFAEGLNVFPQALASGLEVNLRTQVSRISAVDGCINVESEGGERFQARDVVLAMALEQSTACLRTLEPGTGRDGALALLDMFASLPCLTAIAGYPRGVQAPDWDICYPEDDDALMVIGNESAKRPEGRFAILVYQAGPRWSRAWLEKPQEEWERELLARAARRFGSWAGSPEWTHLHRWRYARLDRVDELAAPLVLDVNRSRIGLAGDLFAPGGGMQAAWISGDRLAERLAG